MPSKLCQSDYYINFPNYMRSQFYIHFLITIKVLEKLHLFSSSSNPYENSVT